MRRLLAGALIIASCLLVGASAEENAVHRKPDGYAWRSYHDFVKIGYAMGFLFGAKKAIEELDPYLRQSYYQGEKVEELVPIYNITNDALSGALDQFYSRQENMDIPIEEAVILICREMIPKKDVKMIEREKEILRLPPPQQRVEKIKDHIKEEVEKGKHPAYEVRHDAIVEKETLAEVPLKSEKEVADFWFNLLVPGGGQRTREVVKKDYTAAIIVAAVAALIIAFLVIKKRTGR